MPDWPEWSDIAKRTRGSDIRKLLKLAQDPDTISFAGGMPDPAVFPTEEELIELVSYAYKKYKENFLQYGLSAGQPELRKQIADLMYKRGVKNIGTDNILITNGGQQALDLINRALVNPPSGTKPGSSIALGAPTYMAYWQTAEAMGAVPEPIIRVDKDGLEVGLLEDELEKMRRHDKHIVLAYDVPTFNNPAATSMPEKHRKKFLNIAHEYNFPIIEDDPYSLLRYDGNGAKPLKAIDDEEQVIYVSTLSKTMFPGARVGWIAAKREIIEKLEIIRQPMDLCPNTVGQYIAAAFFEMGKFEPHVKKTIECYGKKRDVMMTCMDKYIPKEYGIEYERPEGGLFNWITLGHNIDSREIWPRALELKVAYVPGDIFYADGRRSSSMRINFSYETPERMDTGMRRLGQLITERLKTVKL
jgi:2-aminoadipate transaminase